MRRSHSYQSVLVPGNTGLLVGIGVGVALDGASLAAEQTVQVGTNLVGTALLDGVALGAAGLRRISTSDANVDWERTVAP